MIFDEYSSRCIALSLSLAVAGSVAMAGEPVHGGHDGMVMSEGTMPMAAQRLPAIRIVSPVDGARVDPNIAVVFETAADLSKMTMGAKDVSAHLHVVIDGTTLMPMMEDLVRLGRQRYKYVFDLPAAPGKHTISVYWSDARHKPIAATIHKVNVTVGAPSATRRR